MNVRPIKTADDHAWALAEIEALMGAAPGTPEGDRLDVLVTLVEAWEDRHQRIDAPDPVAAIRHHMEQSGLEPKDLVPLVGPRHRVYEVLNGTRQLTLPMIRRLHRGLGIPLGSLIGSGEDAAA